MSTASLESGAERSLHQLTKSVVGLYKLGLMFRFCHSLALHAKPFTDFVQMCDFDEAKGMQLGRTYRNDKAGKTFMHYIAKVEKLNM